MEKYFNRWWVLLFLLTLLSCSSNPKVALDEISEGPRNQLEPNMCLAFSGGGVRSASVSIGVLSQLSRSDNLKDFDIISGASGGSWAMYWLYSNILKYDGLENVIGDVGLSKTEAYRRVENTPFIDMEAAFVSMLSSIFGKAKNRFRESITEKFGPAPKPGEKEWETDAHKLSKVIERYKLPMPLVTTSLSDKACFKENGLDWIPSAGINNIPFDDQLLEYKDLERRVLEITPYGWGNRYYGYSQKLPTDLRSMEDWVMASGSFIDHPRLQACKIRRALGASWGLHASIHSKNSVAASDVYLADGGFAENLAVFPLIQRGCKNITIIDAELDRSFKFSGYKRLRANLNSSIGLDIVVPTIDEWLKKYKENAKTKPVFTNPKNSLVKKPVYSGYIKDLDDVEVAKINYMKLSLDSSDLAQYTDTTRNIYLSTLSDKCEKSRREVFELFGTTCWFPHTATLKSDYTSIEFQAHSQLGASMTKHYLLAHLP